MVRDENTTETATRRTILRGSAAVGIAATTGVATFGGQAAAQSVNVDASDLQITTQQGQQMASGLINVQLQNLVIQDVVEVTVGGDVVEIKNVDILSNNEVNINVADAVDVEGTQALVAVTILGETTQGAVQEFTGEDTVDVQQTA